MNAPLPEHIRKALETVSLEDKYTLGEGRAFMAGGDIAQFRDDPASVPATLIEPLNAALAILELEEPWAQRDLKVCVKKREQLSGFAAALVESLTGSAPE